MALYYLRDLHKSNYQHILWGSFHHLSVPRLGQTRKLGRGLLATAWSDRMRGNSFELEEVRCRDIGKEMFTQRVVGHWDRGTAPETLWVPFCLSFGRWLPTKAIL